MIILIIFGLAAKVEAEVIPVRHLLPADSAGFPTPRF